MGLFKDNETDQAEINISNRAYHGKRCLGRGFVLGLPKNNSKLVVRVGVEPNDVTTQPAMK